MARLVARRIQMPPAVWRHAVLGSRCNPRWAHLAIHAGHLAEGERLWFEDILRRIPLQPWEELALAC
jgi:hypothetical protein